MPGDSLSMKWSTGSSDDASSQLSHEISLQVARAREALEEGNDLASAVHEARRAIKRARALLRLAEPWPSSSPTDSTLRYASRVLAPLRDANVMVSTARDIRDVALASRPSVSGPDLVPPTLLEALEDEEGRHFAESSSADGPLSEAGELLRSVVVSTASGGTELLQHGLGASYASVRMRSDPAAGEGPIDERSHKLRKRVKDLRYQLEFLDRGQPKLGRLVGYLHHLTDLLGDANDLTTLARYTASVDVVSEPERAALTVALEGTKQALRSEATALSARLFEEDPDSFVRRVGEWVALPQDRSQGPLQG